MFSPRWAGRPQQRQTPKTAGLSGNCLLLQSIICGRPVYHLPSFLAFCASFCLLFYSTNCLFRRLCPDVTCRLLDFWNSFPPSFVHHKQHFSSFLFSPAVYRSLHFYRGAQNRSLSCRTKPSFLRRGGRRLKGESAESTQQPVRLHEEQLRSVFIISSFWTLLLCLRVLMGSVITGIFPSPKQARLRRTRAPTAVLARGPATIPTQTAYVIFKNIFMN